MDEDITPYVPAPHTRISRHTSSAWAERFGNRMVSDQAARLCFDGAYSFPVYAMPNLEKMIADDGSGSVTRWSSSAAALPLCCSTVMV